MKDFLSPMERNPARLLRLLLAVGLLLLVLADAVWIGTASVPSGALRMEVRAPVDLKIRAWFDTGLGFVPEESVTRAVTAGPGAVDLRFPLPIKPVKQVRIDLLGKNIALNVHAIRVVRDSDDTELAAFQPESLQGDESVVQLTPTFEGAGFATLSPVAETSLRLPLDGRISLAPTAATWAARLILWDGACYALFAGCVSVGLFGLPRKRIFRLPGDNVRALAARWFRDRWAVLLFLAPVACAWCAALAGQSSSYVLEAEVTCDRPIVMQFYWDTGTGYHEGDSDRESVPASPTGRKVRFPIAVPRLNGLRFDPAEGPVRMVVKSLAVYSGSGDEDNREPLYTFDLRTLWPLQQMAELVHEDDGTVRLLVPDGATDPATKLELSTPLTFGINWGQVAWRALVFAGAWFVIWIVAVELGLRLPGETLERVWARARSAWRRLSPAQAIWLVGAASVVTSCYPVIFCGKSFASVNFQQGTYQLYGKFPTLPGTTDGEVESSHGADVATMAWRTAPAAVVDSRALASFSGMPAWNRYNGAGTPAAGGAGSMLGDPLQWLVFAGGGRAWAWDAKFLLAKLVFTAGVGLLVLSATGCVPVALLLTFSAAFLGFFSYRLNHPAFFSVCYAPWMLLAWFKIARTDSLRQLLGWLGALVLVNWAELHTGGSPEMFALLIYLNLTGLLVLLLERETVAPKFRRLLLVAGGAVLFCLVAAPSFVALSNALPFPAASGSPARQLPPGLLIGLFDDIFYRQLVAGEDYLAPATNFLVLGGVLLALSNLKRLWNERVFVAVFASALLLASAIFGLLPLEWVGGLPFADTLNQPVAALSAVLFIDLFILAAFGWRECLLQPSRRRWARDLAVAALLGVALLGLYFHLLASPAAGGLAALKLGQTGTFSPFFFGDAPVLVLAIVVLPFVLRALRLRGLAVAPLLVFTGCLLVIHWRLGIQTSGAFGHYTAELPDRLDLLAHSPAVDFLHADRSGPFRAVGFGNNLMPGYNAVADLESFDPLDELTSPFLSELKRVGFNLQSGRPIQALDPAELPGVKRLNDLLNVRYYLATPGVALGASAGLRQIGKLDLDVYRSESAWPRAYFVDRLGQYDGVSDFVREVEHGDSLPFAAVDREEFLRLPSLIGRFAALQAGRTIVPATNYHLDPNGTSFEVDAPRPGVIVLTEAFFPDAIHARVNGRPAQVFRVNHAFRGIVVDQRGHCRVVCTYDPPHAALARCGALLGWALLAAAGWWLWRTRLNLANGRADVPVRPMAGAVSAGSR